MLYNSKHIFILLILIFCLGSIRSQSFPDNRRESERPNLLELDTPGLEKRDSALIDYFYLSSISMLTPFSDTTLGDNFQSYDVIKKAWRERYNLGNPGSASFPIIYSKDVKIGTNYGYNSYAPYVMTTEDFQYYDVNRPFLDFLFTPVGGQQNFLIKSNFARSFSDGIKLSINYNRIKQEGFYQNQDLKHTNFGLGLWYHNPNERQDVFFTFINSVQSEDQNGGIVSRSSLTEAFARQRKSVAVTLDDAKTRFQHRTYDLQHNFNLTGSQDDEGNELTLVSKLRLKSGYYKFSDPSISGDQGHYGDFLIDDRGLRNYMGYTQLKLSQDVAGQLKNGTGGTLGIEYTYHRINLESEKLNRNDIFLKAETRVPIGDAFNIDGNVSLGLGSSTGDFLLTGINNLNLGNETNLVSNISFYRNQHPIQASTLIINESEFWNNDLSKPFGTYLSGELSLPFLNSKIKLEQTIENNTLFYDASIRPQIYSEVYTATVLDIFFKFKLWGFNFENYGATQFFSNNLFHLPTSYYKYNFFHGSSPFQGKMKLRLGVEGKITGPSDGINFSPLLSVFYNSGDSSDYLPYADLYLSAKVKTFRFFLRYENLRDLITKEVYFQVGDYPLYDRKIRLGIAWNFLD